jgi:hypothetical protein
MQSGNQSLMGHSKRESTMNDNKSNFSESFQDNQDIIMGSEDEEELSQ